MLRIFALQFRFELRIGFTPEIRQVLGDLHRAVTWRKHLNAHANAATGNPEPFLDAVQILDARRNRRRSLDGVDDLHGATGGQLNPLRRVPFDIRPFAAATATT